MGGDSQLHALRGSVNYRYGTCVVDLGMDDACLLRAAEFGIWSESSKCEWLSLVSSSTPGGGEIPLNDPYCLPLRLRSCLSACEGHPQGCRIVVNSCALVQCGDGHPVWRDSSFRVLCVGFRGTLRGGPRGGASWNSRC